MTRIDHGRTLTHDMNGQPAYMLHAISLLKGLEPESENLTRAGFRFRCGWRGRDGQQWDEFTRREDLDS